MEVKDSSENLKKMQPTNTNEAERVHSFSEIPRRYRQAELKDFPRPLIEQIEKLILQPESFFITGVCGSGKTHLAAAILKEYIRKFETDHRLNVSFASLSRIAIEIKGSFKNENGESMDEIVNSISTKSILVLDDIGAFKGTESAVEALHAIIDIRYNEIRTSIYTSNLTLAEISVQYGDRIASRLASFNQIKLEGGDRRLKK